MPWSAGTLPAPLNHEPGMKLLEQAVNDRPLPPVTKAPLAAGSQTVDVAQLGVVTLTGNASGSTVTGFTNGPTTWPVVLRFTDALVTIAVGTGVELSGNVNFVSSANATLTLVLIGAVWYETARSRN